MTEFWVPLSAGIIACLVTTLGIYVIQKFAKWGRKNVVYFMSFASGVLISVSFMHIIPESFEMSAHAPVFLLVGFFALYLFDRFLHGFVCNRQRCKHGFACTEKECRDYAFGLVPAVGIGLHSFIDGIIYSVTFSVSMLTGILAVIGMILHEFPEGIVTFLFLVKSGFSQSRSFLYAFLAAAVTTPLGVLVSWPLISKLTGPPLGILLALSAGALVYVGATHLLPKVEEEKKRYTLLALAAGIGVAIVIILSHA